MKPLTRWVPCLLALAHCGVSSSADSGAGIDAHATDVHPTDTGIATDSNLPDVPADVTAPGTTPMFVAQGYVGRTVISCDDGHTWVGDVSDDDSVRCFSNAMSDCDHNGARAMGLAFGDGWFMASWGWGLPGSVRRSHDAVHWEHVVDGTTFAGLNYGAGRFVAFDNRPRVSMNDGMMFQTASASIGFMGEIRGTGFGDGLFVAAGNSSATQGDVMLSADGLAWHRPTTVPALCGVSVSTDGVAFARGALLLAHDTGLVCRSIDNGLTWTTVMLSGTIEASLMDTGTEFVTWGTSSGMRGRFHSPDGITWSFDATHTRAPDGTMSGGPALGPVARSASGTFVSVKSGWQVWYDQQVFYRSTDGLTWDALPAGAFHGGHPIRFIRYGEAAHSGVCP